VRELIPRLPAFLDEHPALRVDLAMSDQRQDLVSEGVDVALRFGELPDSATATARLLARGQRMLVASPAYLERHGTPATPAQLAVHSVIAGPMAFTGENWTLEKEGRVLSVRVEGRITVSTNEGAVAAAVAGLGLVATSQWGCRAELERGALVRVLPDWQTGTTALHAVFAAGRAAKPSARAFVDYLAGSLRNEAPIIHTAAG
jgi:DNA-binding transcriptional LysR family regulator